MSDSTVTPADVAAKVATSSDNPPSAEHAAAQAETPAQEPDWKSEARKWEERSKLNKAAADELAALKDAQKTEAEKAAEELAALRAENEQFKTEKQVAAWKAEVSQETDVPAAALAGSTKEEIKAHAETLKPLIVQPSEAKPQPLIVPAEGKTPPALNSSALEDSLRKAVGAN